MFTPGLNCAGFSIFFGISEAFPLDPYRCFVIFLSVSIAVIVLTTIVALTLKLHREKLERCRYLLIWNILYLDSIERDMMIIRGSISSRRGSHIVDIVYIMDISTMHHHVHHMCKHILHGGDHL